MLTHLNESPTLKVKHHAAEAGTRKMLTTPFSSWDFEIQEPEDQETYNPHAQSLRYNDLNAYVVDWEMPK